MSRKVDCIYLDVCEADSCRTSCLRYEEMTFMLDNSNIPKARQKFNTLVPDYCDEQAFMQLADIREHIAEFVGNGQNLYIYSTVCGNGKTTWSIKLMLQYFHEMWPANCFTERGLFINVNSFLFDLKDSFDHRNEDIERIKRLIPTVDLVIWDDIAANRMSQYDTDLILSLLDKRVVNDKANIFTGNILPDELSYKMGDRIASRIAGHQTTKIELRGGDRR